MTVSTAVWLIGLYSLYAHWVSSRVEPFSVTRQVSTVSLPAELPDTSPEENRHLAENYLQAFDWAEKAELQWQFGDMFLYANQCRQLDKKGEMRFEPFALLWRNPDPQSEAAPLRIVSDAAVIRFAGSFDLANPAPGRPVYGALEGNVTVLGPDGLSLRGRSFIFEEQARRLWSDRDVAFTYGPHSGTGHGVQIDFDKPPEQLSPDLPAVGPVASVSILRQIALQFMGPADEEPSSTERPLSLKPGEQLLVNADGRMNYQLAAQTITLDRNVRVRRPLPSGETETIDCHLLRIGLRTANQPEAPQQPTESPEEIQLTAGEKLDDPDWQRWLPGDFGHPEVSRLTAEGLAASPVHFEVPEHHLQGNAAKVTYDFAKRQIVLEDQQQVVAQQESQVIQAPHILIQHAEAGDEPELVVCQGPGKITTMGKPGSMFTADWQKELRIEPDPDASRRKITVDGQARISQPGEFELRGQTLTCWWRQDPDDTERRPVRVANSSDLSDQLGKGRLERAIATGKVVFQHARLTARAESLTVDLLIQPVPDDVLFAWKGTTLGSESGRTNPRGGLVRQNPAMQRRNESAAARAQDGPVEASADELELLVWQDPRDADRRMLAHLDATGHVDIQQQKPDKSIAVRFQGDHLVADQRVAEQAQLQLLGEPAEVHLGPSRLEAHDLEWSRADNLLFVEGSGILEHPIDTNFEGRRMGQQQMLRLSWKERLEFDGATAHLYEGVVAALQHSRMHCQSMHVTLQQPIPLDTPRFDRLTKEQTQIATLVCESRVGIEDAEYEGERLITLRRGKLGRFVVDNRTGQTQANGPGWMMMWTRGQNFPDLGHKPEVRTRTAAKVPAKSEPQGWTYLRIDFHGMMQGNLHQQYTTFNEQVEVTYGPVDHAPARIDPDELPDSGAWMRSDALQLTRWSKTETAPSSITLLATGNTELEALTFHARADSVKYDQLKGQYIIESNGTNQATIRKPPTPKDPLGFVKARRFTVNPSLNVFQVDRFTSGGVIGGP